MATSPPPPQPVATMCDAWLGRQTLAMVAAQLAKANQTYAPPAGYPAATLAIELCKGTCGAQGAGPCWLSGKPVPWSLRLTTAVTSAW